MHHLRCVLVHVSQGVSAAMRSYIKLEGRVYQLRIGVEACVFEEENSSLWSYNMGEYILPLEHFNLQITYLVF